MLRRAFFGVGFSACVRRVLPLRKRSSGDVPKRPPPTVRRPLSQDAVRLFLPDAPAASAPSVCEVPVPAICGAFFAAGRVGVGRAAPSIAKLSRRVVHRSENFRNFVFINSIAWNTKSERMPGAPSSATAAGPRPSWACSQPTKRAWAGMSAIPKSWRGSAPKGAIRATWPTWSSTWSASPSRTISTKWCGAPTLSSWRLLRPI